MPKDKKMTDIRNQRASSLKNCVSLMIEYMKTQEDEISYKDLNMQDFRNRTQQELNKVGYDLDSDDETKIQKRLAKNRLSQRKIYANKKLLANKK